MGGANHVETFSNGKRFLYNVKPLKLKFGPSGLFIIDESKRAQNVYYERYSELLTGALDNQVLTCVRLAPLVHNSRL